MTVRSPAGRYGRGDEKGWGKCIAEGAKFTEAEAARQERMRPLAIFFFHE